MYLVIFRMLIMHVMDKLRGCHCCYISLFIHMQVEMALAAPAEKGEAPKAGTGSGPGGVEVALLGALVDAILDPGGAAVACPYLCKLFQGAANQWLADSKDDVGVSLHPA